MIYTLTLNPALDYVMETGKLETGRTNRSMSENIYFGGKGKTSALRANRRVYDRL